MDDLVSWLATESSQSMVADFARTSWRSVGRAIARVVSNTKHPLERITHLRRIGIDEISYRKGHRYLTVVVDHDSGLLIWAAAGANSETLNRFFDDLVEERCQQIQAVTRDGATWIKTVVAERCPNAVQCMDPFHVIKWATDAVDQMRRDAWRGQRHRGVWGNGPTLKGARWALLKNEEDLTTRQQETLQEIRRINEPLSRAHLLKEALRRVFRLPTPQAIAALRAWLVWAFRCQIPAFVKIAKSIQEQLPAINHPRAPALKRPG
jgi:transposase